MVGYIGLYFTQGEGTNNSVNPNKHVIIFFGATIGQTILSALPGGTGNRPR